MNQLRGSMGLAAAALTVSSACAVAWVLGMGLGAGTPGLRAALLLTGLTAGGAVAAVVVRRWTRAGSEAARVLLELAASDQPGERGASGGPATLPADDPWAEVVERVRASLAESWRRAHDAEHLRSALEIRARRSAEQFAQATAILNGLTDPVLVLDEYNNLLLANAGAERMFQLDGLAAGQRAVDEVLRCESLVELLTDARRRRTAAPRTDELELPDGHGGNRWYGVTTSPLLDPANPAEPAGRVTVLHDVSAQKAVQRRHAEFISAVSHEMKTPLAGIKAYVELLVDGDAEDEATREEFLQVINGQADRLQRLIDNLLNLSRIESGVVKVDKRPRPLNELLEEALRIVRPAAEEKNIALAAELSSLHLSALIDRDQMLQAAINLLSNALKYTPAGGRVTLRSRPWDQQVQFEVQDTGVGIGEDDQQRVFERFYRVQKDRQMAPGTGLGLPLAKYIVEDMHGGRLTVSSQLGVGSTFKVTLPPTGQLGPGKSAEPAAGPHHP